MKQVRMTLKGIAFALLAGALATSCKKKNDDPAPPPPPVKNATIQLVHASPKTGELTAEINGKKHGDKLKFLGQSNGYITVSANKDAVLKFLLDSSKVIMDGKYALTEKENYSLFVYDTLLNSKVKALLLKDDLSSPAKGKSNVRFLHLSPDAAAVDIDVFKDKDSLRLVSNTAYVGDKPDVKSLSVFKSVAAGDYRVKVKTKVGGKETTILDIPVIKLGDGKVATCYLSGLTKGMGTVKVGLQVSQHK
jgi:hypothetical protein